MILGETTFGKGSVQSVIPLSDGAALRLTTSKYYTPNGESIQNTGITPDIVEKLKSSGENKAHPVMREKDLTGHLNNEQQDGKVEQIKPEVKTPEKGPAPEEEEETVMAPKDDKDDNQLQRAIDLLKTWAIFKKLPDVAAGAAPAVTK